MTTKLKKPARFGYRKGETYPAALRRWRKRLDGWRDAECMARCEAQAGRKQRRFLQAFTGLTVGEIAQVAPVSTADVIR